MRRRNFFKSLASIGAGSAALSVVPAATAIPLIRSTTWDQRKRNDLTSLLNPDYVLLCRRILEQNRLASGETFIVATPESHYDSSYVAALMTAAAEIGAVGMHVAVIHSPPLDPTEKREPYTPRPGLTDMHWKLFAQADLFFSCRVGAPPGIPGATTSYVVKIGDHPYRTDFELINRPGSRTRWLTIYTPVPFQRRWFPTQELRRRTRDSARVLEEAKEIRVTSRAGSDWVCSTETRPGHAQYGMADSPGRWDNFSHGCAACSPLEDSAEGVVVLEPGDMIPYPFGVLDHHPPAIDERIEITFKDGYITKIEGGRVARMFEKRLASYDDPEVYGISHFGWGTHTGTGLGAATPLEVEHFHHNEIGSVLWAVGTNYGHGLGVDYSGLGETTRIARDHIHFTSFNATCYVDDQRVIEDGKLLI